MKSTGVFLIFFVLALGLYFPAHQSGLTWDFIGWMFQYKTEGIGGFSHLFGDRGLHPLYQAGFYGLYKLFGVHPLGWFLVFLALHVLNSTLSFVFFSRLFKSCGILNSNAIAFLGAFFFLVSPYQTEPVVWKATVHYLVTTASMLSALIFSLDYARKGKWKYLAAIHFLFLIGFFSLEIALSLPILLFILLLLPREKIFGGVTGARFFARVILPQLIMIPVFFLLSKLIMGRWVAHYGASAHLNFAAPLVVGNFNRYLVKYLFFLQFFNYPVRQRIYEGLSLPGVAYLFVLFYLVLGVLLWYNRKRFGGGRIEIFLALAGMCLGGMITTVNLYFNYLINIENDRFGYLGSVFILMTFAYLIFQLTCYLRYPALIIFIVFSIRFLELNIFDWKQSAILTQKLISNFERFNSAKIYLLNTPDNFHGANVFRGFGDKAPVAEAAFVTYDIDKLKQVRDVLYYNMETIGDSVKVIKVGENSLKVSFAQWGNWWWRFGVGARDFENENFSVKLQDGAYIINFKKRSPGDIVLYQCGTEWRVFNGL